MEKVCLDTDTVIEVLKNSNKGVRLLDAIEDATAYITPISVFELFQRKSNHDPIEKILSKMNVLDFSELSARKAASILRELKSKGKLIDYRDLFIASIAVVNNCALATFNKKHFRLIPKLELV